MGAFWLIRVSPVLEGITYKEGLDKIGLFTVEYQKLIKVYKIMVGIE